MRRRRRRRRRRRPDYSPSKNNEKPMKKQHFPKKTLKNLQENNMFRKKHIKTTGFFSVFGFGFSLPAPLWIPLPGFPLGTPKEPTRGPTKKKLGVVFGKSTLLGTQSVNSLALWKV